jgi:hypothetical protein
MTAEVLASWLLGVMMATVPPGRSRYPSEARESAEQGQARYAEIADALARVALDPGERPVFVGKLGRERTAALMLALSYHESRWRRDVDLGLGTHGRYHCLMQVAVDRGRTPDGWTGKDLVASRERCFRAGLHILSRAQGSCKAQGPDAWLRLYTSGRCDRGRLPAEQRLVTLRSWLAAYPMQDR